MARMQEQPFPVRRGPATPDGYRTLNSGRGDHRRLAAGTSRHADKTSTTAAAPDGAKAGRKERHADTFREPWGR